MGTYKNQQAENIIFGEYHNQSSNNILTRPSTAPMNKFNMYQGK